MPYQEEECPVQPLWQSVLLFCWKGMIEGIIILLFIWLLVQVLFTKHQEVHLQLLLGVGLALFCLSLILGCILCCWRRRATLPPDKEAAISPPPTPPSQSSSPSGGTTPAEQQYEELDGDTLDQPSSLSCSTPSEGDSADLPFAPRFRAASELNERPKSFFPLRRFGTSVASLSSSAAACGRTSLSSLPRWGLLSIKRRVLERRCTVTGDDLLHGERSRLTSPTLSTPSTDSVFPPPALLEEPYVRHYGSGCGGRQPAPQLHFSLHFSSARGTLTVDVLSVSSTPQVSPGGVSVHASLPPLCPAPRNLSIRQCSLSQEFQSQSFTLPVGSLEDLHRCTLQMAVFAQDCSGLKEEPLGELELLCSELDWEPNHTIPYSKELSSSTSRFIMSLSSPDPPAPRLWAGSQRDVGELFILLQYQAIAHRIKVIVQKAVNLARLTQMTGVQDHYVAITLRHEGTVIGRKETERAGGHIAVWNTPFLFDLPPGDITQLPLVLEFIVMQGQVYVTSCELGRVVIGSVAPEAGQAHWRDMCNRGQVETAHWHAIEPHSP
ncbi:synaptotagmin 1-like [Conger conger]|uniref:synaptotagmin 1-like n=1 Tax=Conger conger TaxID=82655 RepID=UPI002A5AD641|nr:synaptotagmin 1-like [Conger conger]